MTAQSSLYETDLPIRPEILKTQSEAVAHWSAPGTWWTAAQRVAVVHEVRRARDADPLPPWTAPSTVPGLIADDNPLPAAAVDVIWRLTNHVTTLTPEWYTDVVPGSLTAGQYVEIVGLVAQISLVDSFADGLGLPRPQAGEPAAGDPTRSTPDGAAVTSHWVPIAPIVDESWLPSADVEEAGLDSNMDVPNVRKALSLVPPERIMQWVLIDAHYVPGGALGDNFGEDIWSLKRAQIELIGARTSAVNECFY